MRLTILNKLSPKGKECDPGSGYSVHFWVGRPEQLSPAKKIPFRKGWVCTYVQMG